MGTLGTLYIICGILYTIACVMDGQDVKPLWKRWVGNRLEKAANYFFPINYVTETKYVPVPPPTNKIQSYAEITENNLIMAFMKREAVELLINENKSKCLNAIFRKIAEEDIVNFEVDRETARPNIIVRAWIYVEKKNVN